MVLTGRARDVRLDAYAADARRGLCMRLIRGPDQATGEPCATRAWSEKNIQGISTGNVEIRVDSVCATHWTLYARLVVIPWTFSAHPNI